MFENVFNKESILIAKKDLESIMSCAFLKKKYGFDTIYLEKKEKLSPLFSKSYEEIIFIKNVLLEEVGFGKKSVLIGEIGEGEFKGTIKIISPSLFVGKKTTIPYFLLNHLELPKVAKFLAGASILGNYLAEEYIDFFKELFLEWPFLSNYPEVYYSELFFFWIGLKEREKDAKEVEDLLLKILEENNFSPYFNSVIYKELLNRKRRILEKISSGEYEIKKSNAFVLINANEGGFAAKILQILEKDKKYYVEYDNGTLHFFSLEKKLNKALIYFFNGEVFSDYEGIGKTEKDFQETYEDIKMFFSHKV